MEFTTHFELQSQATRLDDCEPYTEPPGHERGCNPLGRPFPRALSQEDCWQHVCRLQFGEETSQIFKLSSSRFTRRY